MPAPKGPAAVPRRREVRLAPDPNVRSEAREWLRRLWSLDATPVGKGGKGVAEVRIALEHDLEAMESFARRIDMHELAADLAAEALEASGQPPKAWVIESARCARLPDAVRAAHHLRTLGIDRVLRAGQRAVSMAARTEALLLNTLCALEDGRAEKRLAVHSLSTMQFFRIYNALPTATRFKIDGTHYSINDAGVLYGCNAGGDSTSLLVPFGLVDRYACHPCTNASPPPREYARCWGCGAAPRRRLASDWDCCRACLDATWCPQCTKRRAAHEATCVATINRTMAAVRRMTTSGRWVARTSMLVLDQASGLSVPVSLSEFLLAHDGRAWHPPGSLSLFTHLREDELAIVIENWPLFFSILEATAVAQPPDFPPEHYLESPTLTEEPLETPERG